MPTAFREGESLLCVTEGVRYSEPGAAESEPFIGAFRLLGPVCQHQSLLGKQQGNQGLQFFLTGEELNL